MNSEIFEVNEIVSKTNSTIVKIGKLSSKKHRISEKMFICNGIKLFLESVNFNADIKYIVLENNTDFDLEIIDKIKRLQKNGVSILCVSSSVFEKLTEESAPQGIITVCAFFDEKHKFIDKFEYVEYGKKIMMFESVRDPGNVGTIIRNAAAFGIDTLIFSSDCVDIYSPKIIRATMGAIFKVNICVVDDFLASIQYLKKCGKKVLGTALKKDSLILGKVKITSDDVMIIGNEGHGLSQETLELCNNTVLIPMCENTESLNAAIATAIFMWEIFK